MVRRTKPIKKFSLNEKSVLFNGLANEREGPLNIRLPRFLYGLMGQEWPMDTSKAHRDSPEGPLVSAKMLTNLSSHLLLKVSGTVRCSTQVSGIDG